MAHFPEHKTIWCSYLSQENNIILSLGQKKKRGGGWGVRGVGEGYFGGGGGKAFENGGPLLSKWPRLSRLTFQSLPAVFRGVSLMLCTLLYMPQTHHP